MYKGSLFSTSSAAFVISSLFDDSHSDRYETGYHKQKKELEHCLFLDTKINSKQIKDLNMKPETITFLEADTNDTLTDTSLSGVFVGLTPQSRAARTKINNWDYLKLKRLCTVKETMIKPQRQPTKWENIFTNHVSNHD